jgi:type II secretory pathway component PulF
MPKFKYVALDAKGQSAEGEVTAADSRQALVRVRELGHFPTALNEVTVEPQKSTRSKISRADIAQNFRQLGNLIGAGLPVHRALAVLSEQSESAALRNLLEDIKSDVGEGTPLSVALSRFPREFPTLTISLIRTGESTGGLEKSLTRLAELMEKTLQRRAQVVSALIYPAVLVVVAISAVGFLLTYLVPMLSNAFREFRTILPLPTRILISIGDNVRAGWWVILLLVVGMGMVIFYMNRKRGAGWWEDLLQVLPISKRLIVRITAARFSRTLGTLLGGGVPILDALEVAATGAGNQRVILAINQVRMQVREGVPLANALNTAGGFLPALVHVTAVGEETGRLPDLLMRLADSLDFDVDVYLRRLVSLLEPAIIVIMGLLVGFIVLSMLLPIFTLSSTVAK